MRARQSRGDNESKPGNGAPAAGTTDVAPGGKGVDNFVLRRLAFLAGCRDSLQDQVFENLTAGLACINFMIF